MEDNNEVEEINAKLSPEAALLHTIMNCRNKFMDIGDPDKFYEEDPEVIISFIADIINILEIALNCVNRADSESMDAYVYLQSALCHHEGLVNMIRDWDVGDKFLDEDSQKILNQLNEIRPLLIDTFEKCHNRLHNEKVINTAAYEMDIRNLVMAFSRLDIVKAKLCSARLNYKNIDNDDVLAVMKMAAEMNMEEIHDTEVAQAIASYVNSNLPEGKSTKDLDTFDLFNNCLGYKIITMDENGREELQKFIQDLIQREQDMSENKENKSSRMFAKMPSYQLSGNRMLIFEPNGFSTEIPEEAVKMVEAKVMEKILFGLSSLLKLTPKNETPDFVKDYIINNKEYKNEDQAVFEKSFKEWLKPWTGEPTTLVVHEEGKEPNSINAYVNDNFFSLIEGFLKDKKQEFCAIPVELASVFGILWRIGQDKFAENFFSGNIKLEDILEGSSFFKSMVENRGFKVDYFRKENMVRIFR